MSVVATPDTVTAAFIATRDEIAAMSKKFDLWKAAQEVMQDSRRAYLKSQMATGTTGLKTVHGTVYIKRKESIKVSDKEVFLNHIKATESWELADIRAAKKANLEVMGEDRTKEPAPGINYTAIEEVMVNRPSK